VATNNIITIKKTNVFPVQMVALDVNKIFNKTVILYVKTVKMSSISGKINALKSVEKMKWLSITQITAKYVKNVLNIVIIVE